MLQDVHLNRGASLSRCSEDFKERWNVPNLVTARIPYSKYVPHRHLTQQDNGYATLKKTPIGRQLVISSSQEGQLSRGESVMSVTYSHMYIGRAILAT